MTAYSSHTRQTSQNRLGAREVRLPSSTRIRCLRWFICGGSERRGTFRSISRGMEPFPGFARSALPLGGRCFLERGEPTLRCHHRSARWSRDPDDHLRFGGTGQHAFVGLLEDLARWPSILACFCSHNGQIAIAHKPCHPHVAALNGEWFRRSKSVMRSMRSTRKVVA